jgi:hypothetical protein
MEKYHEGFRMPGCQGHEFFRVPGEDREISAEEFTQIQEVPLDKWIENLLGRFEELPAHVGDIGNNGNVVGPSPLEYGQAEMYQPSRLRRYWSQVQNTFDNAWNVVLAHELPDEFVRFQWTCVSF